MRPFARTLRRAILATSTLSVLAFAPAAIAQDAGVEPAGASEDSGDNEIIVTARRRDERLIDVPVAITAYSGDALAKAGAIDITDIGATTPNTTLEASRGTNSTLSAFIRGVGQQDPVSGFEQGVGIYLDDVYLNRPQAAVLDIYEVERIEVLRGPQGTLYGRNTIGGAVKYVTKPLPQEFSLRIKGTYGSYDQADLVVSASAPVSDLLRVGVAGARLSRGGFGDNLTNGLENYNKDVWAGRGTVELGGYGEPVLIRISGDYTKDKSAPRGGHRLIPSLATGAPVLDNVFDTRGGLNDPKQEIEAYGLAMNVSAELSDTVTLRSISAWRKDKSATPIDFDALPAVDVDVPGFYFNEQISQELQLLYEGDRLKGLLGFYYLDATADTLFDVRIFNTFAGLTAFTEADVDTTTFAVFGDFTYDFSDQFSLSVGGRYTWDKRTASILRQNYLGGGSPVFGGAGVPFGAPSTNFDGSRKFNKFTPRVSLQYQPTSDHNFYASYSQGFKGGGFDPRGVGVNAPAAIPGSPTDAEVASFLSFLPEQVDSYEVGYKGSLMDGAVNVALAAFYADYSDVQIPGSVACTVGGLPTFCGVVSNAGKATFKGLEFEGRARLAEDMAAAGDRLTLSTALGYIDAQYKEYVTNIGGVPTDVADFREVQNTPKWTASGTLAYSTPVGDGEIRFGTTLSYRSKTHQFEIPNPYIDQKGFALWDASLVYTAPDDRWSLGLFGKNLTNKKYKTSGYTFIVVDPVTGVPALGANGLPRSALGTEGTLTAFYGNPRQVFVTGTVKF
ncbi:TonB-dependent receptor [Sphingopyxis alaskensis]|jgi:iron complex outermembrane recepter protein|uniref:TonB-dependent receptor n=1 Tax=Sphingopyxis alaskensis (strain DSM 13593 / LMG 18877 / RB2256) TaxID=317655 RepID=Q1GP35_SPHAL|nr:TonB-dependent receptor [Sphingopyxis alaskensis]ABF54587.1 TonB-dependent receptor [Sphingopyxis alaskensis RB2256]MCM3418573.1 TonB-dependent receptor [Sphingopyxis alaskensis]